jgi:Threonine synthase
MTAAPAPAAADWTLECSSCGATRGPEGLPTVCDRCGMPWLVRYPTRVPTLIDRAELRRRHGMWRFRPFLPLLPARSHLARGRRHAAAQARAHRPAARRDGPVGQGRGRQSTGSFKARGLGAAITRAVAAGAERFVLPTAGNAGVAAAAYGARAGKPVRVYAPGSTPRTILSQIRAFGGDLVLLEGHIGDCGRASRAYAAETGALDLSTLREPYRIEGKKTLGLELAMQLGWTLPQAIIYPTGGGTGLIGMWKAFQELLAAGWVQGPLPRMYTVQSTGCAPVVRAFVGGAEACEAWEDPWTVASGLRVPAPLGGRLMLRALRESQGGAVAVDDEALEAEAARATRETGVDFSPEGGAALAAVSALIAAGTLRPEDRVLAFNTGAGWLYRDPGDLPLA